MRSLLVLLAYLVPTSLALVFMLWVLWNFTVQMRRPKSSQH